jgi:thiol-disulfide isomerase/thioredoxin
MKFLVFHISFLCSGLFAIGQSQTQKAKLRVGDKAPAIKVYQWVKGKPVGKFRRGQVYVVELGATWCRPCAEAIPHLTEMAQKYRGKITVVGVFVMEQRKNDSDMSYVINVKDYVKSQGLKMKYHVAVDRPDNSMNIAWIRATGDIGVPKTFIIDKNGLIAWIGVPRPEKLNNLIKLALDTSYNIRDAIEGSKLSESQEPISVDPGKPFYLDGNGGDGHNFLFRSVLAKYNGEKSGNDPNVFNGKLAKVSDTIQTYAEMVQQVGVPISKLYYMAYGDTIGNGVVSSNMGLDQVYDSFKYPNARTTYGKFWYMPILEVADTMPFHFDYRSNANRYNYSLMLPEEKESARDLQLAMQRDLKTYFGYEVIVKDSMMPCWNLTAGPEARHLLQSKTAGNRYALTKLNDSLFIHTHASTLDILAFVKIFFSFGHRTFGIPPPVEAPFMDETHISDKIEFTMSTAEYNEFYKANWNAVLEFIHRYDLNLERGERKTKVIIIRDPQNAVTGTSSE